MTDTHQYDGKLLSRKKEIDGYLQKCSLRGKEEKLSMFAKLLVHLRTKPCFTMRTESNFNTIVRDFELDNAGPNYDPTNHLFAIDLLWLCAELCFLGDQSVADEASVLVNIQLDEMSSGMCPQGRTTRLMQVVCSFLEFIPSTHQKM